MRVPDELLVHLRRARDLADRNYAEPLDLDGLSDRQNSAIPEKRPADDPS